MMELLDLLDSAPPDDRRIMTAMTVACVLVLILSIPSLLSS